MNRNRRNRTASMLDRPYRAPSSRNRDAAEMERLRRARAASRRIARNFADDDRTAAEIDRIRRARMANRARVEKESALERSIAQLNLAVRRLAAIQAKIDKDPLEDVSKDIENVNEPVEEPKEIELGTEDLNEQPATAEDAKEEESDDENPVVESEVVAKRPIRMASRPTASDDFDLF